MVQQRRLKQLISYYTTQLEARRRPRRVKAPKIAKRAKKLMKPRQAYTPEFKKSVMRVYFGGDEDFAVPHFTVAFVARVFDVVDDVGHVRALRIGSVFHELECFRLS